MLVLMIVLLVLARTGDENGPRWILEWQDHLLRVAPCFRRDMW